MPEIVFPKILDDKSFEDVLENLDRVLMFSGTLKLDFSNTEFITSYAMCSLVLFCNLLTEVHNRRVHFILSKPDQRHRLHPCLHIVNRLGFFDCLSENITFYPYRLKVDSSKLNSNCSILEVSKVSNEEELYRAINLAKVAIKKNTQYSDNHVYDICNMISEVLQNILYHSQAPKPGLIAIQKYPILKRTELVISDCGIGIPTTIKQSDDYKNSNLKDYETILESVKRGVSRFGRSEGRGEGLERCYKLSEKYKAILFIRSNKGYARYNFETRLMQCKDRTFFQGTQIYFDFPSN